MNQVLSSRLPVNYWAKVEQAGTHMLWTGAQNSRGYGCFGIDGKSQLVHRLAWENENGPIPDGYTIDHLCRIKVCVNTAHMEVVTRAENKRRASTLVVGGECMNGHQIESDDDIYVNPKGRRECRGCRRVSSARGKAKSRQVEGATS